jgi:signal transduction histidine kinase
MNVLSNAIHAMEGEGTLTITTGMENERMYIRIKDTGKGMTEEVKNRIFEPFYTTKEVGHGTGLGLSISYGIIEKHRGTIHVISEPGKGSEFIIDLPVSQDDN